MNEHYENHDDTMMNGRASAFCECNDKFVIDEDKNV